MRARSIGSNAIAIPSPGTAVPGLVFQLLQSQFPDQLIGRVVRDIHHMDIITKTGRGAVAGADALGVLERDRTVRGRLATLDAKRLLAVLDEFVSPAEHARQAAADPEARLAELL